MAKLVFTLYSAYRQRMPNPLTFLVLSRNYSHAVGASSLPRAYNQPERKTDRVMNAFRGYVSPDSINSAEYFGALKAVRNQAQNLQSAAYAKWLFERLQHDSQFSKSYELYMKICLDHKNIEEATVVFEQAEASETITPSIFSDFMSLLAERAKNDEEIYLQLKAKYIQYRDQIQTPESFLLSAQVYVDICIPFCMFNDPFALEILKDMMLAAYEPTHQLCERLLLTALEYRSLEVLRILTNWYLNIFHEAKLENGILTELIECAAKFKDDNLALLAAQLIVKGGSPLTAHQYHCLILAVLATKEISAVIDILQEMEARKVQFRDETNQNKYPTNLREELRVLLTRNKSLSLENVYDFICQESRQFGSQPSQIVLDAILQALCRAGNIDRAISILQSLPNPNAHNYNAILNGLRNGRYYDATFDFFFEMERASFLNDEAFTTIFLTALDTGEKGLQIIPKLLDLCQQTACAPSFSALRKLILTSKKEGMSDVTSAALQMYISKFPGDPSIHLKYFLEHLENADNFVENNHQFEGQNPSPNFL